MISAAFVLMFLAGVVAGWAGTIVYIALAEPSWATLDDWDVHP